MRAAGIVPTQRNPLNGFHEPDPELGWVGAREYTARFRRPDFDVVIENDAAGFRRSGLAGRGSVAAAEAARPVVFLGDSFVWGWGVPQGAVFTDRLQTALGDAARVVNRGVNGYGTGQERILLERVLALSPRRVLLLFYPNDLEENVDEKAGRRPWFELEDGELVARNVPVRRRIHDPVGGLARRSVALSYLRFEADRLASFLRGEMSAAADLAAPPSIEEPESARRWAIARALLAAMRDACAAADPPAGFEVVYLPPARDVVAAGRGESVGPDAERLAATCAELGIPCTDLTEGFAAAWRTAPDRGGAGEPAYYAHDAHWTSEGHRIAAQLLEPVVRGR